MIEDDDDEEFDDNQATIINMDRFVKGIRGWRDKFHKGDRNMLEERKNRDLGSIKIMIP